MSNIITTPKSDYEEFRIDNSSSKLYKHALNCLCGIGKINFFVGPNNSGKSRFLRAIFKGQLNNLNENAWVALNNALEIQNNLLEIYGEGSDKIDSSRTINECIFDFSIKKEKLHSIEQRWGDRNSLQLDGRNCRPSADFENLHIAYRTITEAGGLALKDEIIKVYIPVKRSIRHVNAEESRKEGYDLFSERARIDYDINGDDVIIFSGQTLYRSIRDMLLGDLAERKSIRKFEKYISEFLFDNSPVALIPRVSNEVVHLKIGSESERPIFDFGDGIQQLIIQIFPLFQYENSGKLLYLFVEEPELNLHPGLQYKYMSLFATDQYKNVKLFFTTHSSSFLDRTQELDDISIFRVEKTVTDDQLEYDSLNFASHVQLIKEPGVDILDSLGIRASSLFLANCSIWVEGIHDRIYIQKILQLVQTHSGLRRGIKENMDYSFIEYGGSNLSHWDFSPDKEAGDIQESIFAKSISNRIFLVADTDGATTNESSKGKLHARLRSELGDRFFLLPCREIENILSEKVVKEVIRHYERDNSKINDELLQKICRQDYRDRYLGAYIDEVLGGSKSRESYADRSGTVKDKAAFRRIALKNMESIEDLSDDAKILGTRILQFIKESCHI